MCLLCSAYTLICQLPFILSTSFRIVAFEHLKLYIVFLHINCSQSDPKKSKHKVEPKHCSVSGYDTGNPAANIITALEHSMHAVCTPGVVMPTAERMNLCSGAPRSGSTRNSSVRLSVLAEVDSDVAGGLSEQEKHGHLKADYIASYASRFEAC